MKCAVALVFLIAILVKTKAASFSHPNVNIRWEAWKSAHEKSYNDKYEETFRQAIWLHNLKKIEQKQNSSRTFTVKLNYLADLTPVEYQHLMLARSYRKQKEVARGFSLFTSNNDLPKTVDWRKKGCVNPVQNQGESGKSWAFSAVGSLEGQHCIIEKKLVSLDEQKLAECCSSCISVDDAFKYMIAHNRIYNKNGYTDEVNNEFCNFSTAAYGASLTGYVDIPSGSENQLEAATANTGPVSIAVDASHESFQFYHSGVYDEPRCSSTQLDHAMLVVGYGILGGKDYWLVKNSWGKDWGMNGYIMMSRNKDNQCGIATEASYPTGVTSSQKPLENHEA